MNSKIHYIKSTEEVIILSSSDDDTDTSSVTSTSSDDESVIVISSSEEQNSDIEVDSRKEVDETEASNAVPATSNRQQPGTSHSLLTAAELKLRTPIARNYR